MEARTDRRTVSAWAALTGVLWALAWPGIGGITPLAFVAWLPMLHALDLHERARPRRSFLPYVLLGVLIWNAATSWWFFLVSEPFGTRLISGLSPMLVNSLLMLLPWWIMRIFRRAMGPTVGFAALVVAWVAWEHLHHDWDLKWPWFTLGNVFASRPAWVQWYEVTGTLGGSIWVWAVNLALHQALLRAQRTGAWTTARPWLPSVALVCLPLVASIARYATYSSDGPAVEVVVVQPNIDPYNEKFGGIDPLVQLDSMLLLAERSMTPATRLVVMPETALQESATIDLRADPVRLHGLWENDIERAESTRRMRAFQERHPRVALLTGMSSARLFRKGEHLPHTARSIDGTDLWYEAYNAALFLPSSGEAVCYNKSKLVAGVEMMPFEAVLGKLGALSVDLGGVSGSLGTQDERSVLNDSLNDLRIAPAICYESVFGAHVGEHVRNGANLIAIITNDGWWGDSPGPRQHLTFASLRAIEMRRAIARSANTGISCWVDPRGVVHDRTPWWRPASFRAVLPLQEGLTFYARYGDVIGRAAWVLLVVLVARLFTLRMRQRLTRRAR
ncbi:MAG: apolipoprotein N-acyltransferase [Flavobacteriales bacterium]